MPAFPADDNHESKLRGKLQKDGNGQGHGGKERRNEITSSDSSKRDLVILLKSDNDERLVSYDKHRATV